MVLTLCGDEQKLKTFFSGVEPAKFALAGVVVLATLGLQAELMNGSYRVKSRHVVDDVEVEGGSLCLMRVYRPTLLYRKIAEETSESLQKVKDNESTITLGNFIAHFSIDAGVWKCVSCQYGDANLNDNGKPLLHRCCRNHRAS